MLLFKSDTARITLLSDESRATSAECRKTDRTGLLVAAVQCNSDIDKAVPALEAEEQGQVEARVVVDMAAVEVEEHIPAEDILAVDIAAGLDVPAVHFAEMSSEESDCRRESDIQVVLEGSIFGPPFQRRLR